MSCSTFSYGFVEFEDIDAAKKALVEYKGTVIDGSLIRLQFSLPLPGPNKVVLVNNLSASTEMNSLKELFPDAVYINLRCSSSSNLR